jgi:mRNA-degrading endonuclease RelE of RelBE toxin-antitoxin system
MPYKIRRTQEFRDQFRRLTKKDKPLQDRLDKKIKQIVQNPTLGDPKSYDLKYTRGSHVNPYVIVYMIIEEAHAILFLYVDHHDFVYNEAPKVFKDIEFEFPELWAVMSPDLKRHVKQ